MAFRGVGYPLMESLNEDFLYSCELKDQFNSQEKSGGQIKKNTKFQKAHLPFSKKSQKATLPSPMPLK